MKVELTNMCMVYDKETDRVVVQKRVKYWTGYTFPGGHVEPGESFAESAAREVFEETGLTVTNLECCGVIHWDNLDQDDHEQYLVYLYRTEQFTGTLLDSTDEGSVEWMDLEKLKGMDEEKLAPNFAEYLKLFLMPGWKEMHAPWKTTDDERKNNFCIYC